MPQRLKDCLFSRWCSYRVVEMLGVSAKISLDEKCATFFVPRVTGYKLGTTLAQPWRYFKSKRANQRAPLGVDTGSTFTEIFSPTPANLVLVANRNAVAVTSFENTKSKPQNM